MKRRKLPSEDFVFFNEDQSEEILPSKEKLKLVTMIDNSGKGTKHMQM